MSKEDTVELETLDLELEVAELEYDVGAVGAIEGTDSQANYAANLVIYVMAPNVLPKL